MNLALILEVFNTLGSSTDRTLAQIVKQLRHRGHRVELFVARAVRHDDRDGDGVTEFPETRLKKRVRQLRFALWARQRLQHHQFDASLSFTTLVPGTVMQPHGGIIREMLARQAAFERTSTARTLKRGLFFLSPKHHILLTLERRTIQDGMIKRYVAVSQYVADQLQQHYQVSLDRIEIVYSAAEMPDISDEQRCQWRQCMRRGFAMPDDAIVFLYAARDSRLGGVESLLEAGRHLAERGTNFILLLAGDHRYGAQRLACRLGIRDKVRFVGTTTHMPELYCAADVTCVPSYYDPASEVVIESLMTGTPAICTMYNGASPWITPVHGHPRGRVVGDPTDIKSLAQAMMELVDTDHRKKCAAATANLGEELSMCHYVDRLESILRQESEK